MIIKLQFYLMPYDPAKLEISKLFTKGLKMSLNKVLLIGRLGRDPELKYTSSGQPVASLSVATDESYTKDGQKIEKTEWHKVVVWGKQAEFCGNYLTKGRLAYIEGKLETRKWQDKDGQEKYTTEIIASRVQALDKGANQEQDHLGPKFTDSPQLDDAPF